MFDSIFRLGSRPSGKPKAEATGLAPEKSAELLRTLRSLIAFGGFFAFPGNFFGGVPEPRPWAI